MMKDFNWVRILRIFIGLGFLGSYLFYNESIFFLLAGGFLFAQGVMNVGCPAFIGSNNCAAPNPPLKNGNEDIDAIEYEVIT